MKKYFELIQSSMLASASQLSKLSTLQPDVHIKESQSLLRRHSLPSESLNYPLRNSNRINLLTYNIFLRPPFIKNNQSDHKDARLDQFINSMNEFDIVCLQEVFGLLNNRKSRLIKAAKEAGFNFHTHSPSPALFSSNVVDGGLVILSRHPIVRSEFQPYPYGVFSDALSQKGILYAQIKVNDEVLHLFSTHTQASYTGETQKYSVLTRGDQFQVFRDFLDKTLMKHYNKGDMVLLSGDFNVDARNPTIKTDRILKHQAFKKYSELGLREHFNEYEAMLCTLSDGNQDGIHDLLHKSYGKHPVTYAESSSHCEKTPNETTLTAKEDLCSNQSLDYIFSFDPSSIIARKGLSPMGPYKKQKLNVVENSAKVKQFFIEGQNFSQLSDHYGVMVTLEYQEEQKASKQNYLEAPLSWGEILNQRESMAPCYLMNYVAKHKVPQKIIED